MIHYTNLSPCGYREQMNNPDARLIHDQRVHDLMEFEKRYKDVYDFKFHLPTDRQELLVLPKGLLNWDKKIHDELCNDLGYKLYCFERDEIYVHEDYEKSLCLTYLPDVDEYKDVEGLDWMEFAEEEPSSLSYNKSTRHEIEKLMGEYLEATREYGIQDTQKEYYKNKLDALYELNQRLK